MELFYIVLGMAMVYSMVHFYVVQFGKTWEQRSGYEKFITILGGVVVAVVTFT